MGKLESLNSGHTAGISYLYRKGNGHTVVLLHGIGSNAASFIPFSYLLRPNFELVIWNAPGYGSSKPLENETPAAKDYAVALHKMLLTKGITRCVLVGHSLGTLIAAEYARMFKDNVSALVLLSCAQGYGIQSNEGLNESLLSRINELEKLGANQFAKIRASKLIYQPEKHRDQVQAVYFGMSQVRLPGYAHAVHMLASGQLTDSIEQSDCPVLVMVGEEDSVTPVDQSQHVADNCKQNSRAIRFVVVPDAGHSVYIQQPERVADSVNRFIEHLEV
ncbi:putative Hydrolase, alpha/beta fold family [Vibrio nigripulchritudo SOn1]|uniref:Hydrolase, alpha/beta fold family n=1 Tax=Vibrio nigripulchritudo SOn1 TaxID=1238450 RepID=A0AAV2VXW1_9VIBR|nr:alpha/beta hydrolase [Vibrio nigripulchritudo]CCO49591.1 putative Hydrolase, alpha/beta fold family [Vibrio nigripulchritudo SOn1]